MLSRTFGCVRVVWNRTLAARHARYAAEGKPTSYAETDRALTAMKTEPDLAFLSEVSSVPLQQALRHQHAAFEDLNVSGMTRRPRPRPDGRGGYQRNGAAAKAGLNKAVLDAGLGEFRRQLEYKSERHGRTLTVTGRWYPSSKTCSTCGHLLAELSLSTRHWTCPSCGARHDRDVNAAKNILAAGRAVARGSPGGACGADVSHSGSSRVRSAVKQEPRRATAGIPVLQGGE